MNQGGDQTVGQIGERRLIDRLAKIFGTDGIGVVRGMGDDTAALAVTPGFLLLATTDAAIEGTHLPSSHMPSG